VEERLDRSLTNNLWFNFFLPEATVETLVAPSSDDYPVILNCSPMPRPHLNKCHFCYENAWHIELEFKELVTNSWKVYYINSLIPKMSSSVEEMSARSKAHFSVANYVN